MTRPSPFVNQVNQIGGDNAYALYLPGVNSPNFETHVNCGAFWQQPNVVLGNLMHWRMWLRRELPDDGGYVISDGYGGAHSLLLNGLGAGNINTIAHGTASGGLISFGADEACEAQQWYELSVGIKTDAVGAYQLIVYMNGIPVGKTYLGYNLDWNERATPSFGSAGGCGTLYIGGSSHINWCGQLGMMQAWDNTNPFSNGGMMAIPVERFYSNGHGTPLPCDLWLDFTDPGQQVIRDLSWGYASGQAPTITNRIKHDGRVGNSSAESSQFGIPTESPPAYPLPYFVLAEGHPWTRLSPPVPPVGRNFVVPAPPAGAKIYDSFSREDVTMAFSNTGGLGSTESGSLGPRAWQYSQTNPTFPVFGNWGIFNGRAVCIDAVKSYAWVPNDSADFTIRVDGRAGNYGNGNTGLVFRFVDEQNHYYATFQWNEVQGGSFGIARVLGGAIVGLGSVAVARGSYTLEIICAGNNITGKLYSAGQAGIAPPLQTLGPFVDANITSSKVGIIMPTLGNHDWGLARYDNFTVF